jgi:glycosyltransferase involved in cell wall biosynthesis
MRIAFLIDYLPDDNSPGGGLQNYVTRIASRLHSLGEDVCVITRSPAESKIFPFPVRQARIPYKEKKILQILQSITFHKIDNSLTQLLDAWAFRRECRKFGKIDIIHSPNYKFPGLFVQRKNSKLVVRASSFRSVWTEEKKPTSDTRLIARLEKQLYARADAIFAPSKYLANILEDALDRPVDVIPSPIPDFRVDEDSSWYDEHLSGSKYSLYFGTILARKGLFVLAEAMKQVWKQEPNALLVLAGPDLVVNGKSNLHTLIELIGEDKEKVIYAHNLQHPQLIPVIRHAHFVVLPSLEDNSPNSMLEGMALGKAILGTIGSSLDEFYPPACYDLLVPRDDVNSLAEKFLWLWKLAPEQVSEYGEESKRYIEERHNPAAAAVALLSFYQRILSPNIPARISPTL